MFNPKVDISFACIASVITEGMVFLHSEGLLDKSLMDYVDEVSENLWRALKA